MGALGLGIGVGYGGRAPVFDWYVDSAGGADGNTGKTPQQALRSIATLLTKPITPGQRIGLARGSVWREQLNVPADGITVAAYGTGAKPLLDCSDTIPAGSWSKTAGRTYVYQASVVIEQFPDQFMSLWENDVRYTIAADVAACDATPGTYYCADMSTSPATVYVHPTDNSNPGTNGKKYEYPRRSQGVQCLHEYCTISGLRTRRNLSNNGSLEVRRFCSVSNCLVEEGTKHNLLIYPGCTLTNVEAANSYYNAQPKALFVWNADVFSGEDITFINCYAHDEFEPATSVGFYGHPNLSGMLGTVSLIGCRTGVLQGALPAMDSVSRVAIDSSDLWIVALRCPAAIRNSTLRGGRALNLVGAISVTVRDCAIVSPETNEFEYMVYLLDAGASLDLQRCTVTGPHTDGVTTAANGIYFPAVGSLISRNNTFNGVSRAYCFDVAGYTVDSDYNRFLHVYATPFRVPYWVMKTLPEWQAETGQDLHSAVES